MIERIFLILAFICYSFLANAQTVAFPGPGTGAGVAVATVTYNTTQNNTTSLTTYTFSGITFSGNLTAVTIGSRANVARTISTVTINGISATPVATANNTTGGADIASVYYATGTTGTGSVVVTFSGAMLRSVIGVYNINTATTTPSANNTATTSGSSPTANISVPTNGIGVGSAWATTSVGSTSFTWSNSTKNYDVQPGTASNAGSGAAITLNGGLVPITATVTGTISNTSLALASWGP